MYSGYMDSISLEYCLRMLEMNTVMVYGRPVVIIARDLKDL